MKTYLFFTCCSLAVWTASPLQADPGKLTAVEFDTANKEALAAVTAIQPSETLFSKADQTLYFEILEAGTLQLELSKQALKQSENPDVRAIIQAEIDEQSALAAKLKEIATAKKVELPAEPSESTQKALASFEEKKGKEADAEYLEEVAIKGHENLLALMEKVRGRVLDASLRELSVATLPLIKTHLKVAKDQLAKGVDGPTKAE